MEDQAVMKIRQPNKSEIEVQFPTTKRKLNYIKNTEESKQSVNKKSIQINTNLEPSQSKKQYQLALAQAKFFKEKDIKGTSNSISCGGITVNFGKNEEVNKDQYEA